MLFDYKALKEYIASGKDPFLNVNRTLLYDLEKLHDFKQVKFFYPKNFHREKETIYFLFFETGYARISQNDSETISQVFKTKLELKQLVKPKTVYKDHKLFLRYENGTEINLQSHSDAEEDWYEKYAEQLTAMYKEL